MSRIIKASEIRRRPELVADEGLKSLNIGELRHASILPTATGRSSDGCAEQASQVRRVLEQAEQEARARLERAEQEAAQVRAEAYAAGYEAGKAVASAETLQEARALLDYLRDLGGALAAASENVVKAAEQTVVRLAIEIAGKILRHEVSLDGSIVLGMVRESLERANAKGQIKLRVSAWDLDRVRDFREDLLRLADDVTGIEIVEDPRVEPGGCIVETEFGCVDARLESQLREVGRAFVDDGDGHPA